MSRNTSRDLSRQGSEVSAKSDGAGSSLNLPPSTSVVLTVTQAASVDSSPSTPTQVGVGVGGCLCVRVVVCMYVCEDE